MVGTISYILQPSFLILAFVIGSTITVLLWPSRFASSLLTLSVAILALSASTPASAWLMRSLESRFPETVSSLPVTGIIVLGGAFDLAESSDHASVTLNIRGGRMTAFVALAKKYPKALLIFSGGSPVLGSSLNESKLAYRLLKDLGVDLSRVKFESMSRNTRENAAFSRRLVTLHAGDRWLLVTSAADMPRAVGSFRSVGWPVVAFPVDYHARPGRWTSPGLTNGLGLLDWATHEWIGLLYYRIRGWTSSLFPGPVPS